MVAAAKTLVTVVFAAPSLLIVLQGPADHLDPSAPDGPVRFFPGADVGLTVHATWSPHAADGALGLRLHGIVGAELVVDEAFCLQHETEVEEDLVLVAPHVDDPSVWKFELDLRRGDGTIVILDLKSTAPRAVLERVQPGEVVVAGARLALSEGADPMNVRALPISVFGRPS